MLATLLFLAGTGTGPIQLQRQWKPSTVLTYEVVSALQVEQRHYMTSIFIPEDLDIKYQFTFEVGDVTPDGFASLTYKRPKIEVVEGETVDSPPVKKTEEVNEHLALTVSPVNAITEIRDLSPKKEERKKDGLARFALEHPMLAQQVRNPVEEYVGDFQRLALFIASPETSMDFGPPLSVFEVEPGDTWDVTATFQPQKLKGKKGKMAPQRIDYRYTYVGLVDSADKKVHRVEGTLALDTDIAPYINDLLGMTPRQSHLTGFKLKLNTKVEFDLDEKTMHTMAARAVATGSMVISVTDVAGVPYVEENLKGRTRMRLVSIK